MVIMVLMVIMGIDSDHGAWYGPLDLGRAKANGLGKAVFEKGMT